MSKDPAVLFYTSDFLSGTFTMSDEHVGMYIRLLCLQHQKGRLTEKDMLSICKAYVSEVFEKFEKEGGKYYNIRLEEETIRRRNYTESRKNNGKKPKVSKKTGEAYAKHMETETETETGTITGSKTKTWEPEYEFALPELHDIFAEWIAYKKKNGHPVEGRQNLIYAYEDLSKLSGNSPFIASEIVKKSIASSFKGLVKPKDLPEPEPPKPPKTQKEIDFENFLRNVEKPTGARIG